MSPSNFVCFLTHPNHSLHALLPVLCSQSSTSTKTVDSLESCSLTSLKSLISDMTKQWQLVGSKTCWCRLSINSSSASSDRDEHKTWTHNFLLPHSYHSSTSFKFNVHQPGLSQLIADITADQVNIAVEHSQQQFYKRNHFQFGP